MNLRQIPLFKNLSEKDLEILKENIKIEEKIYEKGSYIFKQGDIKKDLYFLEEGSILVAKFDTNGKRSIIQTFNKKSIFGEIYAYLEEAFDFSAYVQKKSKLIIIKDFRKLINESMPKSFLINYINLISKKCLISQKNQITNQFTLRQKISNFLLIEEENEKVILDQTREELADFLSTTRPSLSRELSNMADEKIIKIKGREIYIIDKDNLKNLL